MIKLLNKSEMLMSKGMRNNIKSQYSLIFLRVLLPLPSPL
jgi:hypothetical protein